MADAVSDAPGSDDLLTQLVRELRAQQAELNELHRDLASLRDQTEGRGSTAQLALERAGSGRSATAATVARAMVLEQLRGEVDSLKPLVDERLRALEEQCRATDELTRALHERIEHIDELHRVMAAETTARLNHLGVEAARLIEEFSGRLAPHRAGEDDPGAQAHKAEARLVAGGDQGTLVKEFQRRLSKLVRMCNAHSEGAVVPQPQPCAPEDACPDQARSDQAALQTHVDAVAASLHQQTMELRFELIQRLEAVEAGPHRRHGGWHEQGAPQAQDVVNVDDTLPAGEESRPPAPADPAQPLEPGAGPGQPSSLTESQELDAPVSMVSDIMESSTIPEDHLLESMEPLISEELKNNLERLVEKVHEAAVVVQVTSSASLGPSSTFVPPPVSTVATVAPSSATCGTAAVPAAPVSGQAPSPVGAGSPIMLSRVLRRPSQPPDVAGAQCHEQCRLASTHASPSQTPGTTCRTVRVQHVSVATTFGTSSPPSSARRQVPDVPVVLRARVQSPAPKPQTFSPMMPSQVQASLSPTQPGRPPARVQRSVSQGHWIGVAPAPTAIGVAAPTLPRPPAGQRP
mmetsp:Transcript_125509/g.355065  ORF Transcript_125509/g.355065 Transcript_125509/m.355065 type:complete len:576 (+) Transcript_125509:37-1764(+)